MKHTGSIKPNSIKTQQDTLTFEESKDKRKLLGAEECVDAHKRHQCCFKIMPQLTGQTYSLSKSQQWADVTEEGDGLRKGALKESRR